MAGDGSAIETDAERGPMNGKDGAAQLAPSGNICISGWYGADNTGDEAILLQFIDEMTAGAAIPLTVLAADAKRGYVVHARPTVTVREHVRLVGRGAIRNLLHGRITEQIRVLRSCSLFVLGGGSLIHDRFKLRNLIDVLDEIWIAKLLGRPVAIFAIGIGPLRRRLTRWLVARTLSACDLITVRDRGSKQLALAIGVPETKIHVVADPALLLRPTPLHPMRLPRLTSLQASLKETSIGVFLVDDLALADRDKEQLIRELAKAFDSLHDEFNFNFVFIPMMAHRGDDDRVIAHAVIRQMKRSSATFVVDTIFAPDEVMWLAGVFRANVTLRLHALLFSLAQETPVVGIAHDPKLFNALAEFGLQDYSVPLNRDTGKQVYTKLAELATDSRGYLTQLRTVLPERRQAASLTFELMRALLGRTKEHSLRASSA